MSTETCAGDAGAALISAAERVTKARDFPKNFQWAMIFLIETALLEAHFTVGVA
jgi:hypothetical protein